MIRFIVKRILWMIPTVLGVLLIIFTINELMPGDPAMNALGTNFTQEQYEAKREAMGLNDPYILRYVRYVKDFVTRFDLGTSYATLRSVSAMIKERLGVTLLLGILGSLITIIFGMLIGILSAVKQYSAMDYATTFFATFFASMPNFWMALMAIIIFSQKLKLLPAWGLATWQHWILPVVCLGLGPIALVVRITRTSMLDVIRQDYVCTARAKGAKERVVIYKHALRNALIPVITVIGMQLSMIFGGSVIIETIFSIPGMGMMLLAAINGRDYIAVQGIVLVLSITVCVINLLVDIAYAFADPRIKAQYVATKKNEETVARNEAGKEGLRV
ncbi:MAG: ABC transporter permease [Oscillospiraceae bacterium]|jgi:peptide/nickel transport system permease protein